MHVSKRPIFLAAVGLLVSCATQGRAASRLAEVHTSDVALFYRIYDFAHGKPSGEALQRDYIDQGTSGVRDFVPQRIKSGNDLAITVAKNPNVYEHARSCMGTLPAVKRKLATAFGRLAEIDPEATFPPVTILIGRNNSGGTTSKAGVLIGLEVACSTSSPDQADLTERLYHLIAHEYGHVEQFPHGGEDATPDTVLKHSLIEGVAELTAYLISGEVANSHLEQWTRGQEEKIDRRFLAEQDSMDLSHWLYSGPGTPEKPGDLGYWVGYRIARAYYERAADKRLAFKSLLELRDPKAILAQSGWEPGDPT